MIPIHILAETATEASSSPLDALGVNLGAFVIQLLTFVFVFALLVKFAFKPIAKVLQQRRQTIDDGVKLGQKMEAEQAKLQEETAKIIREARTEADRIIGDGQKEAREIIREAEHSGKKKVDAMIVDAEERIKEESDQSRRKLEKEIAGLISEATEAVVEEKMNPKTDAALIEKAMKKGEK